MLEKGGEDRYHEISNKMRNLARLLIEYRQLKGCHTSSLDLIDPENWDDIVNVVKTLCKHDSLQV